MPHLPKPITIEIDYIDAEGEQSHRTIDVYRTRKEKRFTMLSAWCHLAEGERSFR